ncbi:DSBA oxidoreductase [Dendryphion nanum]|uniref:DSBA oxidoreductase n=1 Tax=Dendryphion nanum TaxID=256645 RepID=A0A9P9D0Z3_9PLEO|nr:DSBA oxidoreductase [Dendryphion nanum]
MATIKVDVIIDTGCPFCYIALKRIMRAIKTHQNRHGSDSIIVQWHPLILQPNAPKISMDISTYIASIYGPEVRDAKLKREEALGLAEGIKFNKHRKIGSTYDSHRLIHLAGEKSSTTQFSVVQKLFKGHFEDGQDQSSDEFLTSVAVESGIEKSEAVAWLESNVGGREVEEKIRKATARGIKGVPDITIAGRYPIGTRHDENSLLSIFEKVRLEEIN